jgi:hypothetical protein
MLCPLIEDINTYKYFRMRKIGIMNVHTVELRKHQIQFRIWDVQRFRSVIDTLQTTIVTLTLGHGQFL